MSKTKNGAAIEARDAEIIANADHFVITMRRGPHDKIVEKFSARAEAEARAADLLAANPGRGCLINAVDAQGRAAPIGQPAKALKPKAAKPAKKPKAVKPKAAKPAKPAKAAKKNGAAQPGGQRAAILAAAQAGKLPAAPDFSANTHARFRPRLAEIVALVEAGDIKGLKAFKINPISSSPKALDKYRGLALIALEAQKARA